MRRLNWLTPTPRVWPNCCQTSSQYLANRAQLKLFTSTENAKRIKERIFLDGGGGGFAFTDFEKQTELHRGTYDLLFGCSFRMPTIFIFHNFHQDHEKLFDCPQLFQPPIQNVNII